MTVPPSRANWTARLAWAVLLLVAGAAAATWGLARWNGGARFFGVAPAPPVAPAPAPRLIAQPIFAPPAPVEAARVAALEARLASLEQATRQATGSAGRADALLIAFAARRAIERGVALGYLEPLLIERFGNAHEAAVATIVTASRQPQSLDRLVGEYQELGRVLRGAGADEGWWPGVRRELGSLVSVRRADRPSARPEARFERALAALRADKVSDALSETLRLPGAGQPEARQWIARARRQVAVGRALDSLESAALLGEDRTQARIAG